jgi:hypothetical protein
LVPITAGIVMPGVHDAPAAAALHIEPMLTLPAVGVQFDPMQQRLGRGAVCGVHVRPGAQAPVLSQRQPWPPTMHVVGAPAALLPPVPELLPVPELPPLPELDAPELPPPSMTLPKVLPPLPAPLPVLPLLPHAATTSAGTSATICIPTSAWRADAFLMFLPSSSVFQCIDAQTSEPHSRTQSEFVPQQSDAAVQRAPSAAHPAEHSSASSPGRHRPPQQSLASAHVAPGAPQDASSPAVQRLGAPRAADMHDCPEQQASGPMQISPSAPHLPAGWQRMTMSGPGPAEHFPEQHSLPLEQTSHSIEQPPAGMQRLTPSLVVAHDREQQSLGPSQRSPT